MERLANTPELMDGPLDERILAGNLRDLTRVNRWLGGIRLSARAMARLQDTRPRHASWSLLDIGTGAADIPAALIERCARQGTTLTVHAIDEREEMLRMARARVGHRPDLTLGSTTGGSTLPYPDDAFDIAHCSLVLHHLEPDAACDLLREAARVSRLGVIVNDLDRATRFWLGAWLLAHLATRNRYTRHDAPLSVRRAHRPSEVEDMAVTLGLARTARLSGFLGHRYALVFASSRTAPGPGSTRDG